MLGTMMPSVLWLGLMILFLIVEASTVGLVSIWFAVGALAALIAGLIGAPLWLQVALFLVTSGVMIALLRPLSRKYIAPKKTAMNADRHVGRVCLVLETIDNLHETGAVKLDGVIWTARTGTEEVIPAGEKVCVLKLEGSKLLVERVEETIPV